MIFIMKPEPRKRAIASAMPITAASDNEVDTDGRYVLLLRSPCKPFTTINQNTFNITGKSNKMSQILQFSLP